MHIDIRTIESTDASEIFITAVPVSNQSIMKQAEETFTGIGNILKKMGAQIFEERIFSTEGSMEIITSMRKNAYGDLDDGVSPTYLIVPGGMHNEISGVQIHAVRGSKKPEVLRLKGSACGRVFNCGSKKYITLSGISAGETDDAKLQALAVFENANSVLRQMGGDMHSVVRTWIWLKDITTWYKDFNDIRNRFYTKQGLIKNNIQPHLPASTGIGISLTGGAKCALDLFAVTGVKNPVKFLLEGGEQKAAFEYGSAFSRASRAVTPGGETVFVSGTAAVNSKGETEHIGDIQAQINSTISHVRAILKDMNCNEKDVVHMIAYCKTEEVKKIFDLMQDELPWPRLVVISEICRDELLFEIEVTACPGAIIYS